MGNQNTHTAGIQTKRPSAKQRQDLGLLGGLGFEAPEESSFPTLGLISLKTDNMVD